MENIQFIDDKRNCFINRIAVEIRKRVNSYGQSMWKGQADVLVIK